MTDFKRLKSLVVNSLVVSEGAGEIEQVRVERAKGFLMERHHCIEDDA